MLSECQVYVVPAPGTAPRRRARGRGRAARHTLRRCPTATAPTSSPATGGARRAAARARSRPRPASSSRTSRPAGCGAVVRVEKAGGMHVVHLEDRRGRTKGFPLGPGFLLDGAPVVAHPADAPPPGRSSAEARAAASRTARGSRAVAGARARVASGSRIFVEGRHDAELVEKVWGDDLRVEGVVVEMLDGVDDLAGGDRATSQPGPGPPDGRARRPPRARHQGDRRRRGGAPARPVCRARPGRSATRTSTCGSRCGPSGSAWRRGRSSRAGSRGSTASARTSAGRTTARPTSRRAWKQILGTVRSYADLEPDAAGQRRGAHRLRDGARTQRDGAVHGEALTSRTTPRSATAQAASMTLGPACSAPPRTRTIDSRPRQQDSAGRPTHAEPAGCRATPPTRASRSRPTSRRAARSRSPSQPAGAGLRRRPTQPMSPAGREDLGRRWCTWRRSWRVGGRAYPFLGPADRLPGPQGPRAVHPVPRGAGAELPAHRHDRASS